MKTAELTGAALDWAVAKCLGTEHLFAGHEVGRLHYSTDWAQGGPIIEREKIDVLALRTDEGGFRAYHTPTHEAKTHTYAEGPTPLIAAMRCYVASELGDEVAVPDELIYDKGDE